MSAPTLKEVLTLAIATIERLGAVHGRAVGNTGQGTLDVLGAYLAAVDERDRLDIERYGHAAAWNQEADLSVGEAEGKEVSRAEGQEEQPYPPPSASCCIGEDCVNFVVWNQGSDYCDACITADRSQ